MTPVWRGWVEHGKLHYFNPSAVDGYLNNISDRTQVQVIIRKYKKHRSMPQNRYYWGVVIDILSRETGYERSEMHESLKVEFLSAPDDNTGLIRVKSTTELTTQEFAEYCEEIKRWAAQFLHIVIPDPNQVS